MISLCAITKNEAHCLATMLASVQDFVAEIIIVDTGSTDSTRDIARSHGATVVETVWQNDFAAARNVSLAHARQPWILVLDADEALDAEAIPHIETWTAAPPRSIWLERRHYLDSTAHNHCTPLLETDPLRARGAQSYITTHDLRLFPNISAARYEGAVHESIEEPLDRCGIGSLRTSAIIHHFGHLASAERKREKSLQYIELAQRKVAQSPGDWRAHFQLGVELQSLGAIAESVVSFESALRLNQDYAPIWRQLAIAHLILGEDAQALRLIGEAVSRDGSDAATWQIMGICFSRLGNVAEAARCFRTILDSIPDHPAALASLAQLDKHTEPS